MLHSLLVPSLEPLNFGQSFIDQTETLFLRFFRIFRILLQSLKSNFVHLLSLFNFSQLFPTPSPQEIHTQIQLILLLLGQSLNTLLNLRNQLKSNFEHFLRNFTFDDLQGRLGLKEEILNIFANLKGFLIVDQSLVKMLFSSINFCQLKIQ